MSCPPVGGHDNTRVIVGINAHRSQTPRQSILPTEFGLRHAQDNEPASPLGGQL